MADGIYKRGNGYVAVVPWGKDSAGKYRQKWFSGFKTVAEAKAHRAKVLNLRQQGARFETTRLTVGEYLDQWITGHAPHLSPVTEDSYRTTIRAHLKPALGTIRLRDLGPEAIRQYVTDKMAGGKSAKTVTYHRRILRQAIQQAVLDGKLDRNWVDNVKAPKRERKEMRVLDEEQVRLFLAEAKRSSKHYRLYLAALLTGMRQGELLGLRWRDLDMTLGVVSVQQTFYRLDGNKKEGRATQVLFKTPKTEKSRRTVDLPAMLVGELRSLREEQATLKREFGPMYQDNGLVFCQSDGKPLHVKNMVKRDFRPTLKRAGLPRIRFHDLRHSHATLLFQQGEHPKVVQERLGHSTVGMTLDIYSHSVPGMQRRAATQLGERLFGVKEA